MEVIAFIFARGGSKGVPNKNIRHIAGKPLLAHAIHQAQESKYITKVVVSTDSASIGNIASKHGAEVLIRPGHLATDDSPEFLSWKHAVDHYDMDYFVNVPATCPLRATSDIDATIELLYNFADTDIAFTVKKSKEFTIDREKVCEAPPARRQDLKKYAVVGSCYVTTPQYIKKYENIWGGTRSLVILPEERTIDIDSEWEFTVAKLLMEEA